MPKGYPTTECKGCGRPVYECGLLSATYLCKECGDYRHVANIRDLVSHSGPFFEHWRRRSLAALGVFEPLDEQADRR